MERIVTSATPEHIGETITVSGWIHSKRDHGKVLFVDLRDRTGLLQVVTGPWAKESYDVLQTVSGEDVVTIVGKVAARPEKLINPALASGTVELQAEQVTILNHSEVPKAGFSLVRLRVLFSSQGVHSGSSRDPTWILVSQFRLLSSLYFLKWEKPKRTRH